jgi:hypothetical protein
MNTASCNMAGKFTFIGLQVARPAGLAFHPDLSFQS